MNNRFSLQDRTILVTGASSGIGQATAVLCAELGAKIILLGRNQENLEAIRKLMPGTNHAIVAFDLRQVDEITPLMQQIVADHGLLHGLAHCVGIHMAKPLRMLTAENIQEITLINVTTAILLTKAFRMKQISARPSSIVMLSSVVATVGQSGVSAYALSKGALVAATKSLAVELAPEQIRINAVLPGVIKTPMSEQLFNKLMPEQIAIVEKAHLLGLGVAEDVAYSIAFLLSPASSWMTGSCLTIDGGYTAV